VRLLQAESTTAGPEARSDSAHPHAFALRGSNLVTDALARHFPLELREGEQHVESQPPHGSGGVELLGHGDEADTLLVELLHDLGEVGQRSRQPVDLVDNHRIDALRSNVFEQECEGGPFHGAARKATVIVSCR
jgi:hypothetical protein